MANSVRTNGCQWSRRRRSSYTTLAADKARYCLQSWGARQERRYLLTDRPDEAGEWPIDRWHSFLASKPEHGWRRVICYRLCEMHSVIEDDRWISANTDSFLFFPSPTQDSLFQANNKNSIIFFFFFKRNVYLSSTFMSFYVYRLHKCWDRKFYFYLANIP